MIQECHAAELLLRESEADDSRLEFTAAIRPRSVRLATIKEMDADISITPIRRARFADIVSVEVRIIEDEPEDEQSLEDYFGDWSQSDKEAILSDMPADVYVSLQLLAGYPDIRADSYRTHPSLYQPYRLSAFVIKPSRPILISLFQPLFVLDDPRRTRSSHRSYLYSSPKLNIPRASDLEPVLDGLIIA